MAKRYAVAVVQLHGDGTIGSAVYGYGANDKQATSAQHTELASVPAGELVAGAVIKVVFDTEVEDSGGYCIAEVLKGNGELNG